MLFIYFKFFLSKNWSLIHSSVFGLSSLDRPISNSSGLSLTQYLPSGHHKSNKQLRSPVESPYMSIVDSSFAPDPTPPKKGNGSTLLKRDDPYLDFRHLSPSCFHISSNKLPCYMFFGGTTTPIQRDQSSNQGPSDESRATSSEGNRKKFSLWRPYWNCGTDVFILFFFAARDLNPFWISLVLEFSLKFFLLVWNFCFSTVRFQFNYWTESSHRLEFMEAKINVNFCLNIFRL